MLGMKNIDVIIIAGPTASGKTDVSLELAKLIDIEVISADSRQVFKYMDIGTAKPSKEELSAVRHHYIDILYPDEYFSAGRFGEQAYNTLLEINANGKIPVVVGGSGLYIKALVEGLFSEEIEIEQDIKDSLQEIYVEKGKDELYRMLLDKDIVSASRYYDKNPMRVMRALQYYLATGEKFSNAQQNMPERKINPMYFAIQHNREELYDRINLRTELMWENGFKEETERILDLGYSPKLNSLNTVGYKECIQFLTNRISKEEAIDKMKQNTRRFAKRQLTWFRKIENINWMNGKSSEIGEKIAYFCNND